MAGKQGKAPRREKTKKMRLMDIQDTIGQVAEAITAALEIETEIIDARLRIVGGTGRYVPKIGTFEEGGDLHSGLIYGRLIRQGRAYVCKDAAKDPDYAAQEGELAEICQPIKHNGEVLGLIGLVAFDESQRKKIIEKTDTYLVFLHRMADLIASKLVLVHNSRQLETRLASILLPSEKATTFNDIIGESPQIRAVKQRGRQVAFGDSTVLITGESGSGKELFARAIHFESPRKNGPFVSINCGAIPEMLLESELFGYEKGAFTGANQNGKMGKFELAAGGTLFLDEIGDLPLHLQGKLLHALQRKQIDRLGGTRPVDVDVRIISATNKNLEEMILQKQYREDLYFRLSVIPLEIPPLRERAEDLPLLLDHALNHFKILFGKEIRGFSGEAGELLKRYPWPGNVRELQNAVEYAVNMEAGPVIRKENLPPRILNSRHLQESGFGEDCGERRGLREQTRAFQRSLIRACLRDAGDRPGCRSSKSAAARSLGISESSLYRKMQELGIGETPAGNGDK